MSDNDYDEQDAYDDITRQWERDKEQIEAAWKQPAFSRETIETDQWTAVYLPIPENAARELLEYAHGSAVAVIDQQLYGPDSRDIEAARVRVETLGGMIGELALQEAAAVEPEKVEEARKLLDKAGDMHSHYDVDWRNGEFAVVRTFEIDDNMLAEYGVPAEQEIFRAPTIEALVDKVVTRFDLGREAEPSNENTPAATIEATRIVAGEDFPDVPEVAASQSVRGFFSLSGSLENLGASASRAMHIALGAVIGFFVDEPKLTAQQVHDTLQAAGNVETLHAREVEAATVINAAEHDNRMLLMKGAQQEQDVRLSMTLGTNATAEANLGRDEYEPQRERARDEDEPQRERTRLSL